MDLTDEAKAEIKEAIRILREDGVHIHKSYAAFQKSQTPPPEEKTPPTEGGPPPPKETKTEPPVKQGLWWKGRTSD